MIEDKQVQEVAAVPAPEKIDDMDRLGLDLVRSKEAAARAAHEAAAVTSRYVILQLYMKYGLNEKDAIKEDGTIVKNGAVQ